jgi:hypothetical protein
VVWGNNTVAGYSVIWGSSSGTSATSVIWGSSSDVNQAFSVDGSGDE